MKNHIALYRKLWQLVIAAIVGLLLPVGSKAQLRLNTTTNNGIFNAPDSIVLNPGFESSPIGMQSVELFIDATDCKTLGTAPSNDQNYIISYTPRVPGISGPDNPSYGDCEVMVNIQYFDGFGRLIQNVQVKGSPNSNDLIQPMAYDQYGREAVKYLPYALPLSATSDGSYRTTTIADQAAFYNPTGSSGTQLSNGVARVTTPFSVTGFESSPLDRILEQGASGDPWQLTGTTGLSATPGHTVKTDYLSIAANEVPLWNVNSSGAAATAAYAANTLYKTVSKDENWTSGKTGTTEEFKDLQGHVVLKRVWKDESTSLSTYYVYDDYNNLAYVIPPRVTATSFTEAPTDTDFNNYIYAYHYDDRDRLTEKKIPGKGWEYTVYNNIDQVVATQDAVQRPNNKWTFSKYDGQGRVIMTGEITDSRTHQQITDAIASQTVNWETPNGIADGYTTSSFPTTWNLLYTVNYYDDYTFPGNTTYLSTATGITTSTIGLLTGSKVRVLTTGAMLLTENYYDSEGRVRESIAQNNIGGSDRIVNDYNFTNQLTQSVRTHNSSTISNLVITNQYTYDHMGRKNRTLQQTGTGQPMVVISKEEYNEIGQLKTKHLHGVINGSDTTYLQDVNYAYNERGWLSGSSAPLFSEQLKYNDGTTPQFNGNISQMLYNGTNSGSKAFSYTYDPLNRLTAATSTGNALDESLSYDAMGNITALTRGGASSAALTYSYTGNRLIYVNNSGTPIRGYTYDYNGNAASDGISKTINYNYLNLPQTITESGSTVATYTYNADGQKLQNTGSDGTWDYDNGIVYHNGTIDFIGTEEGRVIPNGTNYSYQYNLQDHLGNNRVSFYNNSGTPTLLQEDEYYSFGLRKSLYDNSNNNRYLYNGKEIQTDLANQYDYGARFYDPAIGRWTSVDPLAELGRRWSPYTYGMNNPIRNVDLDGMISTDANGNISSDNAEEAQAMFRSLQAQMQGDDKDKEKNKKKGPIVSEKKKDQSDGIGNKIAGLVLAGIHTDVATPDPTDGAWPKWVGEAVVGGLAVAYLHSNSDNNPDPHLVYEIFSMGKDGDYRTEKYGITSRADNVDGNNGRPAYQVNRFNKQDPTRAYSWIERARTNGRASAKTIEVFLVSAYATLHLALPPKQVLPKPLPIK